MEQPSELKCARCGATFAAAASVRHCSACGAPLSSVAPSPISPAPLDAGLQATVDHRVSSEVSGGSSGRPVVRIERPLPGPGERFGDYRILRTLGQGGMGAVFEADHLESGRRVALKVLKQTLDSPEARKRFLREGRLAAAINHPHSVYVFGTEEIDGTPAIAMELMARGTLAEEVRESGPMPVGRAVDAALQIIQGLEAAEKLGVLHRDVKPANCFIDSDGNVKIGDFGLSISTEARDQTEVTQAGSFLGTPAFSSPEQLRGDELSARSDMYSVGVTLYYLLTGRAPFEADNVVRLLATVLERPAESPRKWRPDIPRGLANVVLRCLAKTPSERYRDYDELRRALLPFASVAPNPATLGLRCVAYGIDIVLVGVLIAGAQFMLIGDLETLINPRSYTPKFGFQLTLVAEVIRLAYFWIPEAWWGVTLGRLICRLRVAGPDRMAPGWWRAGIRALLFHVLPQLPALAAPFFIKPELGLAATIPAILNWALFLSLFTTARRRNGYAGWHDLASETRVVASEAFQLRPTYETRESDAAPPTDGPRLGPYVILGPLRAPLANAPTTSAAHDATLPAPANDALGAIGEWLLGFDPRLLRNVWIRRVPPNAPAVDPAIRSLGRAGRLRWLASRRESTGGWDAFEAPSGDALANLLTEPRSWRETRFWLLDLAEELAAAERDGTLPASLSLEQVWITAEGRAKLLDFPAPCRPHLRSWSPIPTMADSSAATAERWRDFLARVGAVALDRVPRSDRSTIPKWVPLAPLPISARHFFETLNVSANWSATIEQLRMLTSTPAEATLGRRLLVILALCLPSLATLGVAIAFALLIDQSLERQTEVRPLALGIHFLEQIEQDGWKDSAESPARPATPREIDAFETYLIAKFGDVARDPEQWHSPWAEGMLSDSQRERIESLVAKHETVTEDELRAAEHALGRYAQLLNKTPASPFGGSSIPFVLVVSAYGWLGTMATLQIIAALVARGGLVQWAIGLTIVRTDGADASRPRILWRAIVTWAPLLLIPLAFALFGSGGDFADSDAARREFLIKSIVASVLYLALVSVSASLPQRGLPDRLAGTWLVPRG